MTSLTLLDRERIAPTRRAMALAGAGTIIFSLVLSIGPVLGASGTVKIHHAGSGDDAGNDPHVCAFYAAFYNPVAETGTWQLLDWGQQGHPLVTSGTYDTSGDGVDATPVLSPPASHYRFEWLPTGDRSSKNKMLWVDEACFEDEETEPTQAQDPSQETEPSQEIAPSQETSPSESPDPSQGTDPSQEQDPSQSPDPSQGTDPSQEQDPSQSPDPSQGTDPSQEQDPSQSPDPSQGPGPSDELGPGEETTNPPVEQDVLSGNSGGSSVDALPDTSIPATESGVLATIGLLLILAAHAGSRRERQLPAA